MKWTPASLQRALAVRRVKRTFRKRLGYELNLDAPATYCEKLQWLKLYHLEHDPHVVQCTDKYEVRGYIERAGLAKILPRLYGVWDDPRGIGWQSLPDQFALKLNNGSGPNYRWLVGDKANFDTVGCARRLRSVLRRKHGFRNGEFHYAKIEPRIIAEEYLGADITDYKFYCFNGTVGLVSAEAGRHAGAHVRAYYSADFQASPVEFRNDIPRPQSPFPRPSRFDEMRWLAERLSRGSPHVRVDLYNIGDAVYFGELTFSPECGYTRWKPRALDDQFGDLIDLRLAKDALARS